MRTQTQKKSRYQSKPTDKRKKSTAKVLPFKQEKRRPFAEFSEEVRQFLIDNDYTE